jgi:hypothetical protein
VPMREQVFTKARCILLRSTFKPGELLEKALVGDHDSLAQKRFGGCVRSGDNRTASCSAIGSAVNTRREFHALQYVAGGSDFDWLTCHSHYTTVWSIAVTATWVSPAERGRRRLARLLVSPLAGRPPN